MSVLNKFLLFFFIFNFNVVFGLNICNVDFQGPYFNVSRSGFEVFLVDNLGNSYFPGQNHNFDISKDYNHSFIINTGIFNLNDSIFDSFSESVSSLPSGDGFIVRNSSGVDVFKIISNSSIYSLGSAVYENSNANCGIDGYYCRDINNLDYIDYFCDITGISSGSCDSRIVDSIDCSTKLSVDSDGGNSRYVQGTLIDYINCSNDVCFSNSYSDVCTSSTNLKEYVPLGSSYSIQNINCGDTNYYYCDNLNYHSVNYGCLNGYGVCDSFGVDTVVDTCVASPIVPGTWNSCSDDFTKSKTNIEYTATCSTSGCGQSSSNVVETQSCGSGNYCSGGNCYAIRYHWSYSGFSNCIGSCGSTSGMKYQTASCIRDFDSSVVSNSYCYSNVGNPVLSTSCIKSAYPNYWIPGGWGSCSASCGGGTQTQSVTCSGSCCDPSTKPATWQYCNTQACPWYVDNAGTYTSSNYYTDKKLGILIQVNSDGTITGNADQTWYRYSNGVDVCNYVEVDNLNRVLYSYERATSSPNCNEDGTTWFTKNQALGITGVTFNEDFFTIIPTTMNSDGSFTGTWSGMGQSDVLGGRGYSGYLSLYYVDSNGVRKSATLYKN